MNYLAPWVWVVVLMHLLQPSPCVIGCVTTLLKQWIQCRYVNWTIFVLNKFMLQLVWILREFCVFWDLWNFWLIYVDHLYFWTFSNLFSNVTPKLEVFKLVVQKFFWERISTLWISFRKSLWQIYIFNENLKFSKYTHFFTSQNVEKKSIFSPILWGQKPLKNWNLGLPKTHFFQHFNYSFGKKIT
jgi:hypothetical protein